MLESNGTEVLIARVAATASIAERAATLEDLIAKTYPGREVNLIGHSMVSGTSVAGLILSRAVLIAGIWCPKSPHNPSSLSV